MISFSSKIRLYYWFVRFRNGKLDIFALYYNRFLRLTPLLGILVLSSVTIVRFFGDGPVWPQFYQHEAENCQRYWWSTLLQIQNYVNPGKWVCITYSKKKSIWSRIDFCPLARQEYFRKVLKSKISQQKKSFQVFCNCKFPIIFEVHVFSVRADNSLSRFKVLKWCGGGVNCNLFSIVYKNNLIHFSA